MPAVHPPKDPIALLTSTLLNSSVVFSKLPHVEPPSTVPGWLYTAKNGIREAEWPCFCGGHACNAASASA